MNREAMEYAQALINESDHLDERWKGLTSMTDAATALLALAATEGES